MTNGELLFPLGIILVGRVPSSRQPVQLYFTTEKRRSTNTSASYALHFRVFDKADFWFAANTGALVAVAVSFIDIFKQIHFSNKLKALAVRYLWQRVKASVCHSSAVE
jgi:hypothetical protein